MLRTSKGEGGNLWPLGIRNHTEPDKERQKDWRERRELVDRNVRGSVNLCNQQTQTMLEQV